MADGWLKGKAVGGASEQLEAALELLRGGFSLIPIARDGVKRPEPSLLPRVWSEADARLHATWNPFREEPVTREQAEKWWSGPRPPGLAAVCGRVSGSLEVIDFDNESDHVFPAWSELVEGQCPGLLDRLCVVRTPKPGYHVWLRCPEVATPGNAKLAQDPNLPSGERCLIETRGEGGYALVPGCPLDCNNAASGLGYEYHSGVRLADLEPITAEERDVLFVCARYFDVPKSAPPSALAGRATGGGPRPGDDFDARGPGWAEILEPHGWARAGGAGGEVRWRRPGKAAGWSATTGRVVGEDGCDLLHVFSSSAGPFEAGRNYGKFRAFAMLEHGGDLAAAAKALAARGFGGAATNGAAPRAAAHAAKPPEAEERDRSGRSADEVASIGDLIAYGAKVEYLWPGWIQVGVLTAIAAEGGKGKTRFCADLLRRMRQGLPWPDGKPMEAPRDSLALWVVADNNHDEMVTLAQSFGVGDAVRINAWREDPYGGVSLDEEQDLRDLERRVELVRPQMVVVDTVGNSTDRNLSRQEEAKAYYQPLQLIARKYRCAVLCLTHLNASGKFLGRRVLEKVRVAIQMTQPAVGSGDERRRLWVMKSNDVKPPALGLTMHGHGNEYDHSPPEDPTEAAEPGARQPRPPSPELLKAIEWLKAHLAGGPKPVGNTRTAAEAVGITAPTLYKARDAIKAKEYESQGRKWWEVTSDEGPV